MIVDSDAYFVHRTRVEIKPVHPEDTSEDEANHQTTRAHTHTSTEMQVTPVGERPREEYK